MPNTRLSILLVICCGGASQAETISNVLPPVPEGGLTVIERTDCVDAVTREKGQCVQEDDTAGGHYTIFKQQGQIMFIRQITVDGYTTIYMNDRFNSF